VGHTARPVKHLVLHLSCFAFVLTHFDCIARAATSSESEDLLGEGLECFLVI